MNEPNPFESLRQMAAGYCLSRGLHVVANLAVAIHRLSCALARAVLGVVVASLGIGYALEGEVGGR